MYRNLQVKLCDPCWAQWRWSAHKMVIYKSTSFTFFYLYYCGMSAWRYDIQRGRRDRHQWRGISRDTESQGAQERLQRTLRWAAQRQGRGPVLPETRRPVQTATYTRCDQKHLFILSVAFLHVVYKNVAVYFWSQLYRLSIDLYKFHTIKFRLSMWVSK